MIPPTGPSAPKAASGGIFERASSFYKQKTQPIRDMQSQYLRSASAKRAQRVAKDAEQAKRSYERRAQEEARKPGGRRR